MTTTTQLPLCTDNSISSEEYTKIAKEEMIKLNKEKYNHLYECVEWLKEIIPEEFYYYFDTSAPMHAEINVHIKSHKCVSPCFNLRFEESGELKASDSHFMGGTQFIWGNNKEERTNDMLEIVKKAIAKECNDSSWEDDTKEFADLYWKKLMSHVRVDKWMEKEIWNIDIREEVEKELKNGLPKDSL